MSQYLMSIYQPDGVVPPPEALEPVMREVEALVEDMKSAGAWVFSAGLHPAETATVVRARDGQVLLTDGPYIEGKEHVGGFFVVEAPDLDAALKWARRAAEVLAPLAIEVRPFEHGGRE